MKFVELIARLALSAFCVVTSGDIFFRYFERPAPPLAGQEFLIGLTASGYIWPTVGVVFLVGGVLFWWRGLSGLAIVLTVPVSANIILFHCFLDRDLGNSLPAIVLVFLQLVVAAMNYRRFASLVGH